ncbi:MAG: UDP-N-acetylglucosamine 1-carboxyvinyltransferase [Parcubacteria group bacterium GW2011_GWC2_39_14]|nr:MAG: UDP-N-acetylglucosamine 1-carboxyvinyltransferase [Parcubacteria group bacterium GW2011_GWC2_39_14]
MAKLIINGGNRLNGRVLVNGMKNSATKLIAATLLTEQECILHNVPRVRDVLRMVDLLGSLGAKISWDGDHDLRIQCDQVSLKTLDKGAVKAMRSSIALLGPMLARFHDITLPEPGGDNIGRRPLDTSWVPLRALGATIEPVMDGYHLFADKISGATIILPEFSVGATENGLMAAALTPERTVIKLAAVEPSVRDLMGFLNAMGAEAKETGTHIVEIIGKEKLHGAEYTVAPDNLEVGTFAVAAAATRSDVEISPIVLFDMESTIEKLKMIGVDCQVNGNSLRVRASNDLKAFKLQTMPFPGFPTDLQAPFSVLATQCVGTTLIHDPLFEGRMGHINEMIKMGANATICDPHRVLISGPSQLFGREMPTLDIRSGATLVLAGLVAQGETIINHVEILDRGYENFEIRLAALGADIRREE